MKSSASSSAPSNSNTTTDHPPLARNAQGQPIAMPEGAEGWMVKQETRGRPRAIRGRDGHPFRLPLDATLADLAALGDGTYRLDAVDGVGNAIDYVTTITIPDDRTDDEFDDERASRSLSGGSDLRHALDALTDMARAQADSIRAVTEAQADWVKGLAHAKALPRNAGRVLPLAPVPADDDEDDDDEPEEDDEEDQEGEHPEPETQAAPRAKTVEGLVIAMAPQITKIVDALLKKYVYSPHPTPEAQPHAGPPSSPPPSPTHAPAVRNPMTHLAAITRGLNDDERAAVDAALDSPEADALSAELLSRSVGDAIVFVKDLVALRVRQARARRAARAQATARAATDGAANATPPASSGATEAPSKAELLARAPAVGALLDPGQQPLVLALIARLPPERLAAVAATLHPLSDEEAARWIRDHLDELRAEAGL